MTGFLGIDVRLWQALIAGAVVALGWIVNGWQNRAEARRLKEEKLRDAHKALFAEIRTTLAQFQETGNDVTDALLEEMDRDPDFTPFIPLEEHDRIYRSLLPEIEVLPRATIDAIVAYHSVIGMLAGLASDMRASGFKDMAAERRAKVYRHYLQTRLRAFSYGEYALALISAYAHGGSDAAASEARRFSSQAAGRDDRRPSQGRE